MNLKRFRIPILLFLISLFLNIYGLWWGLPNCYTWSTDDLTPTQPLLIAKNFLRINSQYPIFHFVLQFMFYAPYLLYLYLTGGLISPHSSFPYGFTDPLTSLTVLLVISRVISAVMGSLTVVFVYLSVKTLYGKKAGFFSALSVCLCYIFIKYSHFGNLDIPYTFWFTIAIYFYARLLKTYNTKYYVLLGAFSALSICTKDQIMGFFIFLPAALLALHFKHHFKALGIKRTFLNKKIIYCILAFVLVYLVFNNVLIDFEGYKYRIHHFASGEATDDSAQFPNTFLGQIQLFQDFVYKLEDSVGLGLFFLFLIGFFYHIYKFDDYTFAFLIPLFSYYIFCFGRLYFVWYRVLIPVIIVLSFFAGRFLSDLVKRVNIKKFVYPLIILIFVYSFLHGFSADLSLVYDSRHSAEKWMIENVEKDARIEVYSDQKYLPRFFALGFKNVSRIFFSYKGTGTPPEMLFKPIIDQPDLESLKARNPDYIILPGARYEKLQHTLLLQGWLEKKEAELSNTKESEEEIRSYMELLLSEKAGYNVIKVFNNKIPFSPEPPFLEKRINIPVIILKRED